MKNLISHNFSKWNINDIPVLLITAAYPGSGKTTLAKRLAIQNNAILISTDSFYFFINMYKTNDKNLPYNGMTILDFEKHLYNNMRNDENYEALTSCLEFIKSNPEVYNKFQNHRFCDNEIIFYEKHFIPEWKTFPTFLINKYMHFHRLVIIEGGHLLFTLANNDYFLNNIPLIIVDTPRLRAYYQTGIRYVNKTYPDSNPLKKYIEMLYYLFVNITNKNLNTIYDTNEKLYNSLLDKVSFDKESEVV